jgi:phosphatidylglycerophosphate synthase
MAQIGKPQRDRPFSAPILLFMPLLMAADAPLLFVPVGANPTRMFGMDARTRACRLATNAGFECGEAAESGQAALVASLAYAWDPAWLKAMRANPGAVLTLGGDPVMAHVPVSKDAADAVRALTEGRELPGYEQMPVETTELSYADLRKRDRPFALRLDDESAQTAEQAAYDASYKGVTDLLTLYLWRRPAFHLTRWAAQARLTPNMVTAVGAVFCALAFYFFWRGQYWPGVATGFVFMVLDTVDGKLARCTGASSKWGNVFDHGIDLVHPPFWWWAWGHGLEAYGRPLEPVYWTMVLSAIVGGYVAQRAIEGAFMRRFNRMHIHVWREIDSKFRLITARRNPNMVILIAALLLGRPDAGIVLVAWWTIVSLIFHAVRYAQASEHAARGNPIVSWLS